MAILTVEDLKAYLRIEISTDEDDDLQGVINSAEDLLEDICGRKWVVASGSSVRYYSPRALHQDFIRIHDAVSVTSVTNDGETVPVWATSTGGYQLEPVNSMDWTGETRPYETIRYIGSHWKFDNFRATVAVSASWGWASIPPQIERAAYVLCKDIWTYRDQQDAAGLDEFLRKKAYGLTKRYRREEAKSGLGGPR